MTPNKYNIEPSLRIALIKAEIACHERNIRKYKSTPQDKRTPMQCLSNQNHQSKITDLMNEKLILAMKCELPIHSIEDLQQADGMGF